MLTPDYPFFCKRALFIDDYYTTFNKPNVQLVHDDGGVVGVDSSGLTVGCGATNAAEFRAVVFFSEKPIVCQDRLGTHLHNGGVFFAGDHHELDVIIYATVGKTTIL